MKRKRRSKSNGINRWWWLERGTGSARQWKVGCKEAKNGYPNESIRLPSLEYSID